MANHSAKAEPRKGVVWMKHNASLLLTLSLLLLTACQADVCPPNSVEYVTDPALFPALAFTANAGPTPTPSLVEIGRRMVEVDRVIHGPVCNDTWSGTIYVACDVQVAQWTEEEGPTFFKDCDLTIEPGTVVYVASHNNAAYYNGCSSCHTRDGSK